MALLRRVLVGSVLLAAYNVYAADYSLDASKMAVGATVEENLIVKEECIDPLKTTCTTAEKVKWLTAPLTKIGSLEILGTLQGDFEISVTADFDDAQKGILITNSDNQGIQYSASTLDGACSIKSSNFYPMGIGDGGGDSICAPGWTKGNSFNNLTITIQNGVAKVHINGQQNGKAITFEAGTSFNRILIKGITPTDRLSEVKVHGLQSASTCSSTSTSTTTSTTTTNGACAANYSSTTGLLAIPCLNVTFTQPFGNVQTLNYSVELQQRSGSLSFDLDANKIKQNN